MAADIRAFFKIVLKPDILYPLIFLWLVYLCPIFTDGGHYILINEAKWSSLSLSFVNLVFGIGYSCTMIYVINYFKKLQLGNLLIFGVVCLCISNFGHYSLYFARELPYFALFAIQVGQITFQAIARELPQIAIIGKFSKKCPEGFESTGITLLISVTNTGVILSGVLAGKLLGWFDVTSGHYDNLIWPSFYCHYYSLVLVLLSPFFAIW